MSEEKKTTTLVEYCRWWCCSIKPPSIPTNQDYIRLGATCRVLALLVLIVSCWVYVYKPVEDISYPPAQLPTLLDNTTNPNYQLNVNDYTYDIDPQCNQSNPAYAYDIQYIRWKIGKSLRSDRWAMGCLSNTKMHHKGSEEWSSEIEGYVSLLVLLGLLLPLTAVCVLFGLKSENDNNNNCNILISPVVCFIIALFMTSMFCIFAASVEKRLDIKICAPRDGIIKFEQNEFGDVSDVSTGHTDRIKSDDFDVDSDKIETLSEFQQVTAIIAYCPNIALNSEPNNRHFTIPYKTTPDLSKKINDLKQTVMKNAKLCLAWSLAILLFADMLVYFACRRYLEPPKQSLGLPPSPPKQGLPPPKQSFGLPPPPDIMLPVMVVAKNAVLVHVQPPPLYHETADVVAPATEPNSQPPSYQDCDVK